MFLSKTCKSTTFDNSQNIKCYAPKDGTTLLKSSKRILQGYNILSNAINLIMKPFC